MATSRVSPFLRSLFLHLLKDKHRRANKNITRPLRNTYILLVVIAKTTQNGVKKNYPSCWDFSSNFPSRFRAAKLVRQFSETVYHRSQEHSTCIFRVSAFLSFLAMSFFPRLRKKGKWNITSRFRSVPPDIQATYYARFLRGEQGRFLLFFFFHLRARPLCPFSSLPSCSHLAVLFAAPCARCTQLQL